MKSFNRSIYEKLMRVARALANAFGSFRANAATLRESYDSGELARRDPLTGLLDRRALAAELRQFIARMRSDQVAYLVVLDLNRLHRVNDVHGHSVGDLVLREVANRIEALARKGDRVARLDGDEFAVLALAQGEAFGDEAMLLAGGLLQAIGRPMTVADSGRDIAITACAGIACAPSDGPDEETLLRAAYIAVHRAKGDGENTIRCFELRMDEELQEQAALEADIRDAVDAGAIQPYYQPLIDLRSKGILGFEILARWHHPVRGMVPPDTFIPICERLGLIRALTASMLRQACRDIHAWIGYDAKLALNVSPSQLKERGLPAQVLAILREEGVAASQLEVEITETALVGDIETAKGILDAFHEAGIKVSLDDFGTGFSSLYHLRELKFDKMKIDKSFVQSLEQSEESEKIVDAVLSLANSLGMSVVAEGIENVAVCEKLAKKGCAFGQGYFFGKAIPAHDAAAQLCAA